MDIDLIIKTLNEEGKVIAIKTDTVYGLICNAFDQKAIDKIYDIKKRERKKPLSIFIKNIDELDKFVERRNLSKEIFDILNKYWPGALTVIFKKKNDTFDYFLNGLDTIGIRIPNDETLLNILNQINFPLAETSCNISNEKEYKTAEEIRDKLGDKLDLIVDGGDVNNNIPSTIVSVVNNEIITLRHGEIDV